MVYKKVKNDEGKYIDEKSVRWDILEAHEAWTPQGLNVGWDEYDSIEQAADAYGLQYNPIENEEIE